MEFEKYIQRRGQQTSRPTVSLGRDSRLTLNATAGREFDLGNYRYALLFCNREQYVIGIRFVNEEEDGALRLTRAKSSAVLSVRNFLRHYGIVVTSGIRHYRIERDTKSGLYLIDLKRPLPPKPKRVRLDRRAIVS